MLAVSKISIQRFTFCADCEATAAWIAPWLAIVNSTADKTLGFAALASAATDPIDPGPVDWPKLIRDRLGRLALIELATA
jgi:hypothetical protein